jgi:ABC-type transport system involved in Fe-S cluster assembly fused permease/ATPase subunit
MSSKSQTDRRYGKLAIRWSEETRSACLRPLQRFLDEGKAQLEGKKEREIEESLRRLGITRISVARRPAMISGADKIIRFGVGMLLS